MFASSLFKPSHFTRRVTAFRSCLTSQRNLCSTLSRQCLVPSLSSPPKCDFSTHPHFLATGGLDLSSEKDARIFVSLLKPSERSTLRDTINPRKKDGGEDEGNEACEDDHQTGSRDLPTRQELKSVFWFNTFPFIAFGLLDNAIMICAGESIELMWGTVFGLSTMAAAALGNWVSDLAGLGSAGWVETLFARFGGLTHPALSVAAMNHTRTRMAAGSGRCLGISIGCILGMFPLLFFHKKKCDKDHQDDNKE